MPRKGQSLDPEKIDRDIRQVLHLVKQGHGSKEIADWLGLSQRTVDRYRAGYLPDCVIAERELEAKAAAEYEGVR